MLPAQPNQSLIDGLAVLQALASAQGAIGSRQMARELGLEPTRVNRLLKTLAALGIAQQNADRQYVPGPGMHVLAAQAMFGSKLLQRAMGPLEELKKLKFSVALGVLWRDHVSYLYHASPSTKPTEALGRVGLFPATRSSIGMILLSRLDEAEVKELYREKEIPNFKSAAALIKSLDKVRGEGFALVKPFDEHTTRTLGVAIEHESAGIAVSGEIPEGQEEELARLLKEAAREIAKKE